MVRWRFGPFASGVTAQEVSQWCAGGLLALRNQGTVVSLEAPLTAQTDDRALAQRDRLRAAKQNFGG